LLIRADIQTRPTSSLRSVFDGTFLTKGGFLTLNITNADKNNDSKILGRQGSIFPLIFRTDNNDRVNLTIPFQLQSGQYHIRTLVKVPNHTPLSFDTIWQVGEIKSMNLPLGQHLNNITAISYYDKVNNFLFVPNNRTFTWEVPFEYNLSRIDEGKVKVHEELIIPDYFFDSLNATGFNITMNNQHFDESLFSVDPYTIQNKTIFHYVPKDNALFEISNNNGTQRSDWLMKSVLHLK
jgi:hypothetical protein